MSEQQLYLAVGLPTVVALIGILVNIGYFVAINARIGSLETHMDHRISSLETRLDNRINSLEAKFDILVGKVVEVYNRLVRLEERLKH
jgi:flagellar capping protein FliD